MNRDKLIEEFEIPTDAYVSEVISIIERLENDMERAVIMDMEFSAEYYEQLIWYLTDFMEIITFLRSEPETV